MTAFDYSRAQASADRLLKRFGQAGYLRPFTVAGPVPYNPSKRQGPDVAATFAVISYDAREIDGTRILATDKKALVSASGLAEAPTVKHRLVLSDGKTDYAIVDVQPIPPAETVVAWQLQVRR
jgi:hypothetical protein